MTFSCHCSDAFFKILFLATPWEKSFFCQPSIFSFTGPFSFSNFVWMGWGLWSTVPAFWGFDGKHPHPINTQYFKEVSTQMRQKTKRLLRSVGRPALFSVGTWSFEGRVDGPMTGRWTSSIGSQPWSKSTVSYSLHSRSQRCEIGNTQQFTV